MAMTARARTWALLLTGTLLSACESGFDMDMRRFGDGLDTSGAAMAARTETRPQPDSRGVISYPNYQVAVAQPGDSVASVASRVGLPAAELASYNGLPPGAPLRAGEIVALPSRVSEPSPATGAPATGPIRPSGEISVATIAGPAIDRAEAGQTGSSAAAAQTGTEPRRHRVAEGETAFSIARRYNVPVDALAEWNGLGPDRSVRVGQFLLIPPAESAPPADTQQTRPGQGTTTPVPPSAAEPLPQEEVALEVETPEPPALAGSATEASDTARLLTPVPGRIVRPYSKGRNDGIDIAASPGTPVRAADAGTVAAITRDTEGVPIVVVRHEGDLLTVYAGVDDLKVEKGARVSRGQAIAEVRDANPAVLHFEVREGFESVDPGPFLN